MAAKFKTKKIKASSGILQKNKTISTMSSYQKLQKWIGITLIIAGIIFFGNLGIQAIGNIEVGGNSEESRLFKMIRFTSEKAPEKQEGIRNILIAGVGGKGHDGETLTDSIMLAQLNLDNKTAVFLSIPRDLYVAYGTNTAGKINALYPMGKAQNEGINLLAKKITDMTGQQIDHYMVIDFSGFKQIVDALGGIEVDVPNIIYDKRYPDGKDGYELFALQKGKQILDGKTALKFARSRHSSSDFERSQRQQLLIKAIKDKSLSLGILTNPSKIKDLINSVQANLSTDLTIGDITKLALHMYDIDNKNIIMYNLNNACYGNTCSTGGFLYQPSMAYFGGAWALIPEGASISRLSYYDDIKRFSKLIFEYPFIQNPTNSISIVTSRSNTAQAKRIQRALIQLGFPMTSHIVYSQTGTQDTSHIQVAWNEQTKMGFSPTNTIIHAMKSIENTIPINFVDANTIVTDKGPHIEIILAPDAKKYFSFAKTYSHLPPKVIQKAPDTETHTGSKDSQVKERVPKEKLPPLHTAIKKPIQQKITETP